MNNKLSLRNLFFVLLLVFISIALFALTIGQALPYEFNDDKLRNKFYEFIFFGLPIAILLTLVKTLNRSDPSYKNIIIIIVTVLIAIGTVCYQWANLFTIGFGAWTDVLIIYENKTNRRAVIVEQLYDEGALGYGDTRIVKLTPILHIFNSIEDIDTSKLDQSEWVLVNKEGDIHLP